MPRGLGRRPSSGKSYSKEAPISRSSSKESVALAEHLLQESEDRGQSSASPDVDGDAPTEVEIQLMLLRQRLVRMQQGLPPLELKSFKADGVVRLCLRRGKESGKHSSASQHVLEAKAAKVRADMAQFHYRLLDLEARGVPIQEDHEPRRTPIRNVAQEWVADFLSPEAPGLEEVEDSCTTKRCCLRDDEQFIKALVPVKQTSDESKAPGSCARDPDWVPGNSSRWEDQPGREAVEVPKAHSFVWVCPGWR